MRICSANVEGTAFHFTREALDHSLYGSPGGTQTGPFDAAGRHFKGPAFHQGLRSSAAYEVHSLPCGLVVASYWSAGRVCYGVFCRQRQVRRGTRFGPYDGRVVHWESLQNDSESNNVWEVFAGGSVSHFVDGESEPTNWMKLVSCARTPQEQNLDLVQLGAQIFYQATRDIRQGEELRVWYGHAHQLYMGIPTGMAAAKEQESPGFPCDRCGKIFAYEYYRARHLKYTRCTDRGDRRFPCRTCGRSFDKRDRLRIHVLHVHEKHRPHECGVCHKSFSQSSSLNKHMRVHSGERPYKCPFCVKAFTASSILRTHIRQHSGEKPFKCKHCGRAFASHAAHDSHVRRTHTSDADHVILNSPCT